MGWNMTAKAFAVVILSVVSVLFLHCPVNAAEFEDFTKVILVNQPESGVTLNSYKAWFRDRAKQTFADVLAYGKEDAPIREAGYNWGFNYTNTGNREIAALQISVLAINAFWEYADTFAVFQGAYFVPGKSVERSGMVSFNDDVSALYYAVWIDKVLFADGTVWKMDKGYLLKTIEDGYGVDIDEAWLTPDSAIEINRDTKLREQVQTTGRQPAQ
jgi:hypothetical protein